MTFCGILVHRAYGAAFLVNLKGGFTRVLFSYKHSNPVRILINEQASVQVTWIGTAW